MHEITQSFFPLNLKDHNGFKLYSSACGHDYSLIKFGFLAIAFVNKNAIPSPNLAKHYPLRPIFPNIIVNFLAKLCPHTNQLHRKLDQYSEALGPETQLASLHMPFDSFGLLGAKLCPLGQVLHIFGSLLLDLVTVVCESM